MRKGKLIIITIGPCP